MVSRLVKSFWIFNSPKARVLTKKDGCPVHTLMFKTAKILLDLGNDNYSIPGVTPIEESGWGNVRPRQEE